MKVDKDFELELNKLLCDLAVAKYTFLHSYLYIKGQGSLSLKNKYESICIWIDSIVFELTRRMVAIDMEPISSLPDLTKGASLKAFKPTSFRTIPACIDTMIHLTEIIADAYELSMQQEDDVTSSYLIEMNKYLENEIWLLKSEYVKPSTEKESTKKTKEGEK